MPVALQPPAESLQQHLSARVERPENKIPLSCHQFQRRVDEADIPTAVAARIFVATRKDGTSMCIQLFEQRSKRLLQGQRLGLAHDLDAAGRAVVVNMGAHNLFSIKKRGHHKASAF